MKTHILFVDMSQYPLGESLDPDVEGGIVDPATFLDVRSASTGQTQQHEPPNICHTWRTSRYWKSTFHKYLNPGVTSSKNRSFPIYIFFFNFNTDDSLMSHEGSILLLTKAGPPLSPLQEPTEEM